MAGATGSNAGGLYRGSDGVTRYVKFYTDPAQAAGEHVANRIYADLGLGAPKSELFRLADGRLAYASELLDNQGTLGDLFHSASPRQRKAMAEKALEGYAADILTANWDAAGLTLDNMVRLSDGSVARIDNGGSFLSRAMGARKPAKALGAVEEWWKYLDGSNAGYQRLAQEVGTTRSQQVPGIADQIDRILGLHASKGGWTSYVQGVEGLTAAERKGIVDLLDGRTEFLRRKRDDLRLIERLDELEAARPNSRWELQKWGNSRLTPRRTVLTSDEHRAVRDYTGGSYQRINSRLRGGKSPTRTDRARDRAIAGSVLQEDLLVYRGADHRLVADQVKGGPASEENAVTDAALTSSSLRRGVAEAFAHTGRESVVLRVLVPKGTPAMWVDDFSLNSGEQEVLLPRGTKLRVLYSEWDPTSRRWRVDAVIVAS